MLAVGDGLAIVHVIPRGFPVRQLLSVTRIRLLPAHHPTPALLVGHGLTRLEVFSQSLRNLDGVFLIIFFRFFRGKEILPWTSLRSFLFDNIRILAHFRIPALMEKDMGRAGYDFQSPDNEKPRSGRGTEPCPRKSYSSTRPCSRASSTPWCARRSSGSSTRYPTLQADEIANAARYERSGGRKAYRAGHHERSLTAKAGRPGLKVPKLKGALFESAMIERYRRREESVEEALIDMYLAGVSTRQVDDTGQLPWGDRMPSQTLSDKLKRVYAEIDEWRTRPLDDEYPYVFVDGVWHKRSWSGSVENVSILIAIGVSKDGHREVIGVAEGMREDSASWEQFFRGMIERGLKGVRLVVGDRCAGLVSTVNSMLPEARYQRCMVRFMRNVLSKTPPGHREWASAALKAVFAGITRIRVGQGRDRHRGDEGQEAEGRRQLPAGGDRRDHGLPAAGVPGRAPQAHPHERHDRTAQPRDQAAHARRGQLPGREQRAHARLRAHQVRHRERMVQPALPRHVPAR